MSNLCRQNRLAIMAALHDLNLAAQYCDRIIMLKEGSIFAEGSVSNVVTPENVRQVYGADVHISAHPVNQLPVTLVTARNGSNGKAS